MSYHLRHDRYGYLVIDRSLKGHENPYNPWSDHFIYELKNDSYSEEKAGKNYFQNLEEEDEVKKQNNYYWKTFNFFNDYSTDSEEDDTKFHQFGVGFKQHQKSKKVQMSR